MSATIRSFGVRWSALTWFMTFLVIAVIAVATVGVASRLNQVEPDDAVARLQLVAAALAGPSILAVVALFAPLGYGLTPTHLVVRRLGPNVRIAYDEIAGILRLRRRDLGFGVRTGASGGFLGFYGRFWSRRLRSFRMYATNARDLVLVTKRDGSKIVLSPRDADQFIEAVGSLLACEAESGTAQVR